jgi:hypothetical protein
MVGIIHVHSQYLSDNDLNVLFVFNGAIRLHNASSMHIYNAFLARHFDFSFLGQTF